VPRQQSGEGDSGSLHPYSCCEGQPLRTDRNLCIIIIMTANALRDPTLSRKCGTVFCSA
jgi:hypothetical protein